MRNVLTRKILLPFKSIGSNIRENIKKTLEETLYNKCSKEGYIKKKSIWSIGKASVKEIERLNILHASLLAMKRAIKKLKKNLILF